MIASKIIISITPKIGLKAMGQGQIQVQVQRYAMSVDSHP